MAHLERIGVHPEKLVKVVRVGTGRPGELLQPSHLVGEPHAQLVISKRSLTTSETNPASEGMARSETGRDRVSVVHTGNNIFLTRHEQRECEIKKQT